jgi:hypothetical protein
MSQLILNTTQATAHLTTKFPYLHGVYTPQLCWIDNTRSHIQRAPKQHYMTSFWNSDLNKWMPPKSKHSADIILLFLDTNPQSTQCGLPYLCSLNILPNTTIQDIVNFANNPNHIFSEHQQNTILNLYKSNPSLLQYTNSQLPTFQPRPEALLLQDQAIPNLLRHNIQLKRDTTKNDKTTKSAAALQTKIFRAYTANKYGKEAGWDTPEELNSHEWHICDEQGRLLEQNTANWQNNLLVYTHMFDLPTLAITSSLSPYKITNLAQIIENITGTAPRMPQAPT